MYPGYSADEHKVLIPGAVPLQSVQYSLRGHRSSRGAEPHNAQEGVDQNPSNQVIEQRILITVKLNTTISYSCSKCRCSSATTTLIFFKWQSEVTNVMLDLFNFQAMMCMDQTLLPWCIIDRFLLNTMSGKLLLLIFLRLFIYIYFWNTMIILISVNCCAE